MPRLADRVDPGKTQELPGGPRQGKVRVMLRAAARWRSSPAALLAAVAACAPGYDPVFRRDVDRRVEALSKVAQTFPPPASSTPLPLKVGAWTQHKMLDASGQPAFFTMKLVGDDFGGATWLELLEETYRVRTTTKILVYLGDRSNVAAMEVKAVKTKEGSGKVTEADGTQIVAARARWQGVLDALGVVWQAAAQEDVTVPAGTFSGCYRRETPPGWGPLGAASHVWWHPLVPLTGIVRAQAIDSRGTMELVAFGEHGAVSEIQ
jgi:hypothetical protein